jgi:putative DNA primase/helicase
MNCTSETDTRASFSEKFLARPADRLAADDTVSRDESIKNLTRWIRAIRPSGFVRPRIIGSWGEKDAISTGSFTPDRYGYLAKLLLHESDQKAEAVCLVYSRADDRFLGCAKNELRNCTPNNPAETDADIVEDDIVRIDCDPVRPPNCCATVEEKEAAWQVACEVADYLLAHDFPCPAIVDSGNGYHVIVRAGSKVLPVGEAYEEAKKRGCQPQKLFLDGLNAKFGTGAGRPVKIDSKVGNGSHPMRVPETINRKGNSTPERPHRKAQVVTYGDLEDTSKFVTAEQFAAALAGLPIPEPKASEDVPQVPERRKPRRRKPGEWTPEMRARAYLETCAVQSPAIEGQHGSDDTMAAARVTVWGWDLGIEKGLELMLEIYNPRCVPPWPEGQLRRKCEEATVNSTKPRGWMLDKNDEQDDEADDRAPRSPQPEGPPSAPPSGSPPGSGEIGSTLYYPAEALAAPTDFDEKPDDPNRLSRNALLSRPARPIRSWRGNWYEWDGDKSLYAKITDQAVRRLMAATARRLFEEDARFEAQSKGKGKSKKKLPVVRPLNTRMVTNAIEMLRTLGGVTIDDDVEAPTYIGNRDLINMERAFVARNAIVDLRNLVDGHNPIVGCRDPRFFILGGSDAVFDLSTPPPTRWLSFLKEVFEEDTDKIKRLQEWFGYSLTYDTSLQKILFFIGQPNSGKGTIIDIYRRIIGASNICSFQLAKLGGRFALEPFIGKTVAICPDARIDRLTPPEVLATLLQISGEDRVAVDRKNREEIDANLRSRLVIVSNDLPTFRDPSAAIARRALPLTCHVSFEDKKDPDLKNKLAEELPGILLWSIQGWNRIKNRRQFSETGDDETTREDIRQASNNAIRFVHECCTLDPTDSIELDALYTAYKKWCERDQEHPSPRIWFRRNLNAGFACLRKLARKIDGDQKKQVVEGIRLRYDSPFN